MKERPALAQDLGPALCELFGFDLEATRRIVLDINPGDVVTMDVERYVSEPEAGQLKTILERYRLEQPPVEIGTKTEFVQ